MRKIILVCLISLFAISCLYAQSPKSMGLVYSLGIFSSKMADGAVVGDGEYVLTKKDVVFEKLNEVKRGSIVSTYGHINPYPLFVSAETGDIYECSAVAVLDDWDLALLKLPIKLKCTNKIEEMTKIPTGKFEINPVGKKVATQYIGINRNEETGEFSVCRFESKMGILEKSSYDKRFFMCDEDIPFLTPGGMLIKDNKLVGIMNSFQPLDDFNKKKSFMAAEFCIISPILDYCKENNIPFTNAPTADSQGEPKLDCLKEANSIFSQTEFGTDQTIIEATDRYSLKDSSAIALALKGMALENSDEEEAKKTYEKALETAPKQAYPFIRYANIRKDKITALKDLLKDFPNDYRIYERLAVAYAEQKNSELAYSCISQAIKYNPEDPVLILQKAKFANAMGKDEEVINCFRDINRIVPRWADAIKYECEYFIEAKDTITASQIADYWLKLLPESFYANLYRAEIYYMSGYTEEGDPFLEKAKSLAGEENLPLIEKTEKKYK